jgi:hypothetical protein
VRAPVARRGYSAPRTLDARGRHARSRYLYALRAFIVTPQHDAERSRAIADAERTRNFDASGGSVTSLLVHRRPPTTRKRDDPTSHRLLLPLATSA